MTKPHPQSQEPEAPEQIGHSAQGTNMFPVKQIQKRQYTKGRKAECAKCSNAHLPYHRYCRQHKNEYNRDWQADRTMRLRQLEQINGS